MCKFRVGDRVIMKRRNHPDYENEGLILDVFFSGVISEHVLDQPRRLTFNNQGNRMWGDEIFEDYYIEVKL